MGGEPAVEGRLRQCAAGQRGVLYPALHKLEVGGWITAEWKPTENNRRAKFYSLTRAGRKALAEQAADWERLSSAVSQVLRLEEAKG